MSPAFMRGLVETKRDGSRAGAKPAEAIARATGSSPGAAYSTGLGPVGAWDIDYAVRNGLERVIWVFRCVDVIATNQARLSVLLRRGYDRQNGKVISDDRLWKLLNFRTNEYERAWQTRYRLSATLLLARRGAFLEVVNGEDGRPSQLHLLPPGSVEPVPDQKTFVSKYRVRRGDYQIDELDPDRVIWLRLKPHPTDPYAQLTPLMAAGIEADTDWLARIFNRNFLANDGRPGLFISLDGGPSGISPDDMSELKSRLSGGPMRAGQNLVVEATGMNVQDMGTNPRDVQWSELLSTSKERILLAFGVPESVMGNASGRTFDNADAERENFWIDTMIPHCDNIAASFDPLSGDIDDNTVFGYNYEEVDVLQRMIRSRREEWRQELAAGAISLATYLERTGQKVIDHPAARAYFLPNGVAVPGTPDDADAVKALTVLGGGTAIAPTDPSASAEAGARRGAAAGMRSLGNIVAARALAVGAKARPKQIETKDYPGREGSVGPAESEFSKPHTYARDITSGAGNCVCGAVMEDVIHREIAPGIPNPKASTKVILGELVGKAHPYLGLRHRFEGELEGAFTAWDVTQEKVVCERLVHVKSRKGTRHWDGNVPDGMQLKALDPSYAVEVDRWVDQLKASVEAMVRKAVRSEVRTAASDLKTNGILDLLVKEGATARRSGSAVNILFGPGGSSATDDIVNDVMDIVEKAARNQSARLMDTITELDEAGKSMRQIEQAIRTAVGARSKWRKSLAVNVVTAAVEGARASVYQKAGKYVTKQWNTIGDERVRKTHRRVDGTERKNGQAFRVGSSQLQYPGDPSGEPEDVINCRCYLEWRADFDELAK